MGKVFVAPEKYVTKDYLNDHVIFLAGSIEMDTAENWQIKLANKLKQIEGVTILNPRRTQWDNNLKQDINEPKFKEQVNWELDGIESSDTVIFYFDPKTKSPISLLELGMVSSLPVENVIVCCPEGFWRKGNVDIVCDRMKNKKQTLIQCKNFGELLILANNFIEEEQERRKNLS